ncbi:MAG: hypothetical protein A3A58_03435 [Candidatus Blackburnbacteria bacterium RIFCSPLOWO2_01_FULL_41_27]|uniref:Antitoxin n=2 Tax=Candidatus Blackburniibacteriota TaxID=1817898 RepID=A0A1G1VAV8_9BACT|nr:MAG: hypothetical protein A3F61_03025 [Candidatus Blackburnbacteria bacterium RIFCSPHIGHO2_12_FULL_41_13b]OGY13263.1 MAG: hypothetical protein A3A58_03435 [Candidatus Blackburnbacteria bacterium RIFCSPLOWO2_01_FULL_41_27]
MLNTVSITNLKQNTADVIEKLKKDGVSILVIQRSEPAAVLVDPEHYETLVEALEDIEDIRDIEARKNEPAIPFDKYFEKRFKKKFVKIKTSEA